MMSVTINLRLLSVTSQAIVITTVFARITQDGIQTCSVGTTLKGIKMDRKVVTACGELQTLSFLLLEKTISGLDSLELQFT